MNSFCGFELINIGYDVISKFSTTNFQWVSVRSRDLFFKKMFCQNFQEKSENFKSIEYQVEKLLKKVSLGGRGGLVGLGLIKIIIKH